MEPHTVRRAQRGGLDAGIRDLHARPVRLDAERRLAAARHGADADQSVQSLDPVVDDWAQIKAPTLSFGGAEDSLPGSAAVFRGRMKFVADSMPSGNGRLLLISGPGHVPHVE